METAVNTPTKMLRLYKYPALSGKYVLGTLKGPDGKPKYPDYNGRIIQFIKGRFTTDDPKIIEELDAEVANGNPDIVIDTREKEIDSRSVDPLWKLREQIRAEELAKLVAATDPTRDMGESVQGKLNPASTTTMASVAAGAGPNTAALLAALKTNK